MDTTFLISLIALAASLTACWGVWRGSRRYTAVEFRFQIAAEGDTKSIGLGFEGSRPHSRDEWLVEFTRRALLQARHYWPDAEPAQVEVRMVSARFSNRN